jgi:ElaB/YqjD/DUF883 family membrane-anchored ribosome-binding protein
MSDISSASNRPGDGAPTTRSSGNSSLSDQMSKKAADPDEVTSSASLLGRDASQKLAEALGKQLSAGAGFIEEASESLRAAAAKLDERLSPLAYGLRTAARSGDDLAEQLRTRSLAQLLNAGSTYARQKPLLVFGAAAAVGLLLSRFAKSTRQRSAARDWESPQIGSRSAQSAMDTRATQAKASPATTL